MVRIIDLVKPLVSLIPEVTAPGKNEHVPIQNKLFWTAAALLVYLVCSQVPLYGITASGASDPFYIMRMILASNKGTLMELGISPIITSGMIMQLLSGAGILDVDLSLPADRALFNAASKLLGIIITIGEAVAYVLAGAYGPVSALGATTAVLLILQLFFAGLVVLVLDDLLSKGWGLGGGINLFIVTNICEGILWGCFSPMTYNSTGQTQFEGAIVALFHLLLTEKNPLRALRIAFFRPDLPNISSLLATAAVFLGVIYIQGFKLDLPIKYSNARGQTGAYPIKLFYTSNMPIILLSALVGNVYFFSQLLFKRYGSNPLVRLFGVWQELPSGRTVPTWGLSYIISPPDNLADVFYRPFHAAFYVAFMLTTCALFAKMWIEVSGSGPRHVAKQLRDQKVILQGASGSGILKVLERYIPTAAAFGGMCVALLSITADLLGAIGSGTGILMCVTIIFDLWEKLAKEGGLKEALKQAKLA